ncbi:MAG TPA: WXG100 family type VII secretion target [Candidatus Brachybacterium merdigallinarum]|jgi:uncharacterized protein YukE|nr:WXG100 family type VII secretion target [Candidatus Brachybacterium merdigallinarum]
MKKGMDPEAVEQLATQIEETGQEIQGEFQRVQGRVSEFDWTGEDRDQYVAEFDGTIAEQISQIVQTANEFGERARKNAAEQREASA